MTVADFDTETVILFAATVLLLALAVVTFCLRLRVIVPMFLLIPFLIAVTIRHVGDMGPMHYIDGGIYLMGCLAFVVSLVSATVVKTLMATSRKRRKKTGNHAVNRSGEAGRL